MAKTIFVISLVAYIVLGLLGFVLHAIISFDNSNIFLGVLYMLVITVSFAIFRLWKSYIKHKQDNTKSTIFIGKSMIIAFFLIVSIIIINTVWYHIRNDYWKDYQSHLKETVNVLSVTDSPIISSQGNPVGIRFHYTIQFNHPPKYYIYLLLGEHGHHYSHYDISSDIFYTLKSEIIRNEAPNKFLTVTYSYSRDLYPYFIKPIHKNSSEQTNDFFGIYPYVPDGSVTFSNGKTVYPSLGSCSDFDMWQKLNSRHLDEFNVTKQLDFSISDYIDVLSSNTYNLKDFYDTTIKEGVEPCKAAEQHHNGFRTIID